MPLRPWHIGCLAFAALAALSGAAAAGWANHGETIFQRLAEAAWTACF